ncbi:hypothetical protein T01_4796 [Trichinella spiralis]|uniref:Uncharacterized protein n=1 Tax=Trichinella spiralis TaxID=6334 RepID=A0A0V1BGS1_TRISP|nr:hypothetical protein T01_4796 [Trichinella spiralis]
MVTDKNKVPRANLNMQLRIIISAQAHVVKADQLSEPSSFSLSGSFRLFIIIPFTHPMFTKNSKRTVDELNCQDGGTLSGH